MNNFWISWKCGKDVNLFPLPCWVTGFDSEDLIVYCAAIQSDSEDWVRGMVEAACDGDDEFDWRFFNQMEKGWTPFCDRFQRADWMLWHEQDPESTMVAVEAFNVAYGCTVGEHPGDNLGLTEDESQYVKRAQLELAKIGKDLRQQSAECGGSDVLIRLQLIVEEIAEIADAIHGGDQVNLLKEIVDLHYVTIGAYLLFGYGSVSMEAFRRVHESNMSKLGKDGKPIISEAGRVVKGPDYQPPDMAGLLYYDLNEC